MAKLIFIYNANSGKLNSVIDSAHKILNPHTYNCNLCALTFDTFLENRNWKKFRKTSNVKMDFLHMNEFKKSYASKFGYKFTFPIVLIESNNELEVFITTERINELKSVEELMGEVDDRLRNF